MLKKTLYPKTKRIPENGPLVTVTEKMDGENLTIFKLNGEIQFAQHNWIFSMDEMLSDDRSRISRCKGLKYWAKNHKEDLERDLVEGSAICGEWMRATAKTYPAEVVEKDFYMFAKANIGEGPDGLILTNIWWNRDLFKYPFANQAIPDYIGVVPLVDEGYINPSKEVLDAMYEQYTSKVGGRKVEGFVICSNNVIRKYLRMRKGKPVEYHEDWRKSA